MIDKVALTMEYATHEELHDGPLASSGAITTKVDKVYY